MNIGEALRLGIKELGQNKGPEAQMLLAFVVGKERPVLLAHTEDDLTIMQEEQYLMLLRQRKEHIPLQYLTNRANFYGRDFYVDERVLIPRFDTEVLLECALERIADGNSKVADICTGSGILAISVAMERNCETWAVDLSEDALAVAKKNATLLKADVRWEQGDLFAPLQENNLRGYFDVIMSNPPYITGDEMVLLDEEVKKEPAMALYGGNDGLDFYRRLAKEAQDYLKNGGYLLLEIGYLQGQEVKNLLDSAGFTDTFVKKDWQGHDRVVCGRKK